MQVSTARRSLLDLPGVSVARAWIPRSPACAVKRIDACRTYRHHHVLPGVPRLDHRSATTARTGIGDGGTVDYVP